MNKRMNKKIDAILDNPKLKPGYYNILETDIHKKSNFVKIFQLLFPIGLAIFFIILAFFYVKDSYQLYSLVALYYVPPSGKESIIPLATSIGVRPLAIALGITINDMLISLFLVWNISYIKKVPYVGKALAATERKGRELAKKYKSFRNIEFIMLILFIAFPFKGSGGIMGTLVGLIVGMRPYIILLAMFIGTFFGAVALAYGSDFVWRLLPFHPLELGLMVLIFFESLILVRMIYVQFLSDHKGEKQCK